MDTIPSNNYRSKYGTGKNELPSNQPETHEEAEVNNLEADLGRARDHEKNNEYEAAYVIYRDLAERNIPEAMYALGLMLKDGRGVIQDYLQAVKYLERAAKQDNVAAAGELVNIYCFDSGGEKDASIAFRYFKQIADHKNEDIKDMLKQLYPSVGWYGEVYSENDASFPKDQPYRLIPADALPINLNGKAEFYVPMPDGSTTKIVCRHLATQYIKDVWKEERDSVKFDWTLYSSEDSIMSSILNEACFTYTTLQANSNRYDLINNDNLGKHLKARFEDMQQTVKKGNIRTLLIESTTHAMAIRLCIKDAEDKSINYVVSFYEPNITNGAVCCETNDLSTLEKHTLEQYITGTLERGQDRNPYMNLFKGIASISMVTECDSHSFTNDLPKKAKKLTSFADGPLTATHILFLLNGNFSHDFVQLKDRLKKIGQQSPQELANLLPVKNELGVPVLSMALQNGQTETVRAYGELLLLSYENEYDKLVDLLAAKSEGGKLELYMALKNGHIETVLAYGEVLLQLFSKNKDDSRLFELLILKNNDHIPVLCLALATGETEIVKIYGELLKKCLTLLNNEGNKLVDLLAAKHPDGCPGIMIAFQKEYNRTIAAYGALLRELFPKDKFVVDDKLNELALVCCSEIPKQSLNLIDDFNKLLKEIYTNEDSYEG